MIWYILAAILHAALVTYVYVRNDWHMDSYFGNTPSILFMLHLIFGTIFWPLSLIGYAGIIPCWFAWNLAIKHSEKNDK